MGIHTSQAASKTGQQNALVNPQVGKRGMFGYPVANGLKKLLGEAANRKGHCTKSSWNYLFSTLQIFPLVVQLLTPARH